MTYATSFYPKAFCQRAVQLWKSWDNKATPKDFVKRLRDLEQTVEINHVCEECGSSSQAPQGCIKCSEDTAFPVVSGVMRDIPEDDEGEKEREAMQKLMRVHKNLGHPSNRLLVHILKRARLRLTSWTWQRDYIVSYMRPTRVDVTSQTWKSTPGQRVRSSSGHGLQLSHYSRQRENDGSPLHR